MLHSSPRLAERDGHTTRSGDAHAAGLSLVLAAPGDGSLAEIASFGERALATPFQDAAWIAHWLKPGIALPHERPAIVLGYEEGELMLVLPLAVERRFGFSSLVWLGQDLSDYNCPLADARLLRRLSTADAAAILTAAAALVGGVDCLKLEKQPSLLGGLGNPFANVSAQGFTCDAHATRLTGDWESFHARKRSRKSAKRLKEKANSLAKLGDVTFAEVDDPAERREVVSKLLDWKSAQLDARGSRNPFRDGRLGELLLEASASPDLEPLIRIHVLRVGGELAAGAFGFARAGHYIYYMAAYDGLRLARYSPGAILLTRLVEEMHGEGYQVFDFSNGDERYKDEWCDQSMGLTVTLMPLTLAGRAAIALEAGTLWLIREIKARPQVFSAVRGFVSRLRSLRGLKPA